MFRIPEYQTNCRGFTNLNAEIMAILKEPGPPLI